MDKYNLSYREVLCTGVEWNGNTNNVFYFTYNGTEYRCQQVHEIFANADTDHIRHVIDEFLDLKRTFRVLCADNDLSVAGSRYVHGCLYWFQCAEADIPRLVCRCFDGTWREKDGVHLLIDFEDVATYPDFRDCTQYVDAANRLVAFLNDEDKTVAHFDFDRVYFNQDLFA